MEVLVSVTLGPAGLTGCSGVFSPAQPRRQRRPLSRDPHQREETEHSADVPGHRKVILPPVASGPLPYLPSFYLLYSSVGDTKLNKYLIQRKVSITIMAD